MKLTLGDVRPTVAKMLSMSSTDSRVVDYINEAQERLLYKGKWPNTYARYSVTNSNGTITWPRQLETIESVAVDDRPAVVRNEWFEFLETGIGLVESTGSDSGTLVDRGQACTFSDISASSDEPDKNLKVYYNSADNGKTINFQGYDDNGSWIITQSGSTYADGVTLTFDTSSDTADTSVAGFTHYVPFTGAGFTQKWTSLVAVRKDVTNFNVQVYEVEATGEITARLIADYEPTETSPIYRRSLITGLADDGSSTSTVTVVGKLRFIPAIKDADWLFINYESPIKELVMSIRKAEQNLINEAQAYEARAVNLMEEYLMHYLGDGAAMIPKFTSPATHGGGGVANIQ